MLLKQASADVVKDESCHKVREQDQSGWDIVRLLCPVNAIAKHLGEICEAELVHWVDERQVSDNEVQDGTPGGSWSVVLTGLIDRLLSNLSLLDTILYMRGEGIITGRRITQPPNCSLREGARKVQGQGLISHPNDS